MTEPIWMCLRAAAAATRVPRHRADRRALRPCGDRGTAILRGWSSGGTPAPRSHWSSPRTPCCPWLIAAGVAVAAALSGRSGREVGLVLVTVLVGRATAGWLNDVADRQRDIAAERLDKPVARGWVHPEHGDVHGRLRHLPAGAAVDLQRHHRRRRAPALGRCGLALQHPDQADRRCRGCPGRSASACSRPSCRTADGAAVSTAARRPSSMTLLAALLGVGVHFLTALPDLVGDHHNGVRSLPMRRRAAHRRAPAAAGDRRSTWRWWSAASSWRVSRWGCTASRVGLRRRFP